MQTQPSLPDFPTPAINPASSAVSIVTVATAKHLIASGELKIEGARRLFDPVVWPQLEPELRRIPCDQPKTQCFRECITYLMDEATALRSEHRPFDALKHIDAALTLEALLNSGYGDA